MQDAIWESRSTVLAPVMQDGTWFLVRMRPDGTVEKALEGSRDGLRRLVAVEVPAHAVTSVTGMEESAGRSSIDG